MTTQPGYAHGAPYYAYGQPYYAYSTAIFRASFFSKKNGLKFENMAQKNEI